MIPRTLGILIAATFLVAGVAIPVSMAVAGDPAAASPPPASAPPAGGLKSIDTLIGALEEKYGGHMTEVELERRPWGDYYEIEVAGSGFAEWDVIVDARSGEILNERRDLD